MFQEMPSTLSLVGRLSPSQVWDYLNRMKTSTSRVSYYTYRNVYTLSMNIIHEVYTHIIL